ncbi:MAG TPA: sensor histidine kinase [Vicinamibacterales bacterium]|nr:sensor histidine kinase [Vicinamibacterales bacterium]HPW20892.1 sensor histidine kinase [Vicinamibacterales bacterium]
MPHRPSQRAARPAAGLRRIGGPDGGSAQGAAAAGVEALKARSDALAERVKELRCLYSISGMLKRGQAELGDILQEVVNVLPSACQYPELACASITLKSRCYRTAGVVEPRRLQRADILVDRQPVGVLELGYAQRLGGGPAPEFLEEEQTLLETVAGRLSEVIALKEAQSQLATYQEHLRSMAAELAMAEERERRSLAISLHDRIGQGLAVAKLKLETLKHVLPPQYHTRLDDITALIKDIVNDTRSLTIDISPPILYELGLEPAVSWLGEHITRQSGLPVDVYGSGEGIELNEGVRVVVFRSIQELLINAVKHSGASRVSVRISRHGADDVRVVVEDNGAGFVLPERGWHPSAASGFGLFSLRERIGHLGGTVEIESGPGRGTRVVLTVPGRPRSPGEEARG